VNFSSVLCLATCRMRSHTGDHGSCAVSVPARAGLGSHSPSDPALAPHVSARIAPRGSPASQRLRRGMTSPLRESSARLLTSRCGLAGGNVPIASKCRPTIVDVSLLLRMCSSEQRPERQFTSIAETAHVASHVATGSAYAVFMAFAAQGHTPHNRCVRFHPPSPANNATLATQPTRAPATPTRPVSHRQTTPGFALAQTSNPWSRQRENGLLLRFVANFGNGAYGSAQRGDQPAMLQIDQRLNGI